MATESEPTHNHITTRKWQLQERPFPSNKPVIGPIIDRLRQFWNNISVGWYVHPVVWQQNEINQELVDITVEVNGRLVSADHDQADLARQVAALTYAINKMNQRLSKLEDDLASQAAVKEPQS
jgi:ribosome-associated translation inhibitor RaiA